MWLFTHLWRLDEQDSRLKIFSVVTFYFQFETSIRVLPRQILSDRDDFYLFEIGRPTCRFFVFCWSVSETSIRVKPSISVKRRSVFCRVTLCPIETIFTFLKLADQTTDFLFSVDSCHERRSVSKTSIRVWQFCRFVSETSIRVFCVATKLATHF